MKKKQLYNIHINSLSFKAIIGILDFERVKKQKIIVDFSSTYDKNIEFIDYGYVAKKIKKMIKKNKYFLIEDALMDIKNKMQKKYKTIKNINIQITKPDILQSCKVGVSIICPNKTPQT